MCSHLVLYFCSVCLQQQLKRTLEQRTTTPSSAGSRTPGSAVARTTERRASVYGSQMSLGLGSLVDTPRTANTRWDDESIVQIDAASAGLNSPAPRLTPQLLAQSSVESTLSRYSGYSSDGSSASSLSTASNSKQDTDPGHWMRSAIIALGALRVRAMYVSLRMHYCVGTAAAAGSRPLCALCVCLCASGRMSTTKL